MSLYAVAIIETYPRQCVVVWDIKDSAEKLADHLNTRTGRNAAQVVEVDSFFPPQMTDADSAWLQMTDSYLRGDHHNADSKK